MHHETTEAQLRELAETPTLSQAGNLYANAVDEGLVAKKRNLLGSWTYTLTPTGREALTGRPVR